MIDQSRLLFIHGLAGSSQGLKATLLRRQFPDMISPDFPGEFEQRMAQLAEIVGDARGWTLIGSSLGGLMATLFACRHPQQVERLVLFAPALPWLPPEEIRPVAAPTILYHGKQDDVVPLNETCQVAMRIFTNLDLRIVDDDHGLAQTAQAIDWLGLVASPEFPAQGLEDRPG